MPRCLFVLIFCWLTLSITQAQPSNDDCHDAISLPFSSNWCSSVGAYTNVGATPSNFGPATCFGSTQNDVWFKFVSVGTDVNITIIGNQPPSSGGTLQRPQVALYIGNCTSTSGNINQLECASATGNSSIVDLYKGGLIIGQTYLIRVQGISNNTGTFQICAQNYNAPAQPGGDCISAAVLCDKSPFVVQSVVGAGNDPNEASNSCLGGLGGNSESNSTWFKWTCDQTGSFTFTLTPNNASDDLDFVLFELPNGINNCNGKTTLRCMAAGESLNNYPSPCHGPTGLNFTATDVTENAGCSQGQDNWLSAVTLTSGKSYALMVNNFSATGNGFQIEFGGTATFVGPTADFAAVASAGTCAGEAWTLTDNSNFSFGSITDWNWTFGTGANPATANSQGPHSITYNSAGEKSIVLSVTTDRGCVVSHVVLVDIDSCCQTLNAIQHSGSSNDILCRNNNNGSITITPTGTPLLPYNYTWSNGANSSNLNNLAIGNYMVTISNGVCTAYDSFAIGGPPPWQLTDSITRPTCDGGTDGAIEVLSINGSNGAPYSFNWNNTGFNNTMLYDNLSNGVYGLVIQDNQGCDTTISYDVHELELELDSVGMVATPPSCFGYSDGTIQVAAQNGLAPYSYVWNHGATGSVLNNLPAGTYILDTIWDANRCRNWMPFTFTLTAPDSLVVNLDSVVVSCTGNPDGALMPMVTGGTYAYQYLWSTFQTDSVIQNLGAGTYSVTVQDANNCKTSATATLTEPPLLTVDYDLKDISCYGYSDGRIRIIGNGGRPGYQYALDPSNFGNIDSFMVASGDYTLYVKDAADCIANLGPITVTDPDLLIVDAGPDREITLGDTIHVEATLSFFDWYTYDWTPSVGYIDCPSCRKTYMQPVQDQYYYIKVVTENDCIAIDSFLVEVDKDRGLFIPNAFSPNGDRNNDYLDVYTRNNVHQIKNYMIFDRWGELLYHRQNIPRHWRNFGWDGKFRGEDMQPGVFVYMVEVEFIDGEVKRFTGDVTLFR